MAGLTHDEIVEAMADGTAKSPNVWLNGGGDLLWACCTWRGGAIACACLRTCAP